MVTRRVKHALLTGFEPFGNPRPDDNRSWETIRQLAGEQVVAGDTAVICHCYEIPVSYAPISEIVPRLHLGEEYSIVIHCGAGVPGAVLIEKLAHRCGYDKAGNNGEKDVPADGCVPGYQTADELHTAVGVEELRDSLRAKGWDKVVVSLDAGRYLCDYTYYTSLAEAETTYKSRQLAAPKTLFIHVPPMASDPYSDKELAEIIRDILRCLA
ncbi:peptidase C15, pyroglutamyl peptidase I-like protein [Martensiomyces pterosporus]|nr:peptidase C15, pyroglutamyl peptidase I-like protein [Martensiomyces pterosporus]